MTTITKRIGDTHLFRPSKEFKELGTHTIFKAGTFPMRLDPDDWLSGDNVWLLDVVAADRKQATSLLANFRQLAGQRPIKIAPTVARLIDPEALDTIRVAMEDDCSPINGLT